MTCIMTVSLVVEPSRRNMYERRFPPDDLRDTLAMTALMSKRVNGTSAQMFYNTITCRDKRPIWL